MIREIKFRGKRYGDGDWVYGNLYQGITDGKQYSIILKDAGYHVAPQDDRNLAIAFAENEVNVVFTQTVGQFTEQLDKNGKEIWEHDIVRVGILSPNYIGSHPEPYYVDTVCIYKEGAFLYKRISPFDKKKLSRNWTYKPMHRYDIYSTEVIGNIHDEPELLKGGAE